MIKFAIATSKKPFINSVLKHQNHPRIIIATALILVILAASFAHAFSRVSVNDSLLQVSKNKYRTDSSGLGASKVGRNEDLYIFISSDHINRLKSKGEIKDSNIVSVKYLINPKLVWFSIVPTMPAIVRTSHPYDLAGTNSDGTAKPLNPNGLTLYGDRVVIMTEIKFRNGSSIADITHFDKTNTQTTTTQPPTTNPPTTQPPLTNPPTTQPPTTNPPTTGTCEGPHISANICLNPASIPGPAPSSNVLQDEVKGYTPTSAHGDPNGNFGAIRTECGFASISKNDPIVFPGQKNASHWHMFYGNTAADENLTDPVAQGSSTCTGGAHNKTGYWAPALIDTNSYNPTTKQFNIAQPMSGLYMSPIQVYYKSDYDGVLASNIQTIPRGLKMIAGADLSRPLTGPVGSQVTFECITDGNTQSIAPGHQEHYSSIPSNCAPGNYIQASIGFPQCGARNSDGTPVLDSPNHRSHMSYGAGWPDKGCPSTHPIAYPKITEHFRWKVPASGSAGLRFVSDRYSANNPAGWGFHADWFNGWNPSTLQKIINNCFTSRGIVGNSTSRGADCSMNLFEPVNPSNPRGPWRGLS